MRDLEESQREGFFFFGINEKNIIRVSYDAKNFSNPLEAVIHLDLRLGG